jgi:hypothetical protein
MLVCCFAGSLARNGSKPQMQDDLHGTSIFGADPENRGAHFAGDPEVPRQRLTIVDLAVLTTAVGVGIAPARSFLSDTHSLPPVDREWGWRQVEFILAAGLVLMAVTPGLTLIWIINSAHMRVRLLSLRPGAIACLLASVMMIAFGYHLFVQYATAPATWAGPSGFRRIEFWRALLGDPPTSIGLLILSVWNLLVFRARWAAEPTWIDSSGRVVGLCWIAWAVLNGIIIPAVFLMVLSGIYEL